MSSSDVAAGVALVKKWAAVFAEMQVSLRANGVAQATFVGRLETFKGDKIFVSGRGGNGFVDLSYVTDARDVLSEEGLKRSGLSPESYGECVTFSTSVGVDVTLICLPKLRPTDELPS